MLYLYAPAGHSIKVKRLKRAEAVGLKTNALGVGAEPSSGVVALYFLSRALKVFCVVVSVAASAPDHGVIIWLPTGAAVDLYIYPLYHTPLCPWNHLSAPLRA